MRSYVIAIFTALALVGAVSVGCAPLDQFFQKDPATGKSQADDAAGSMTGLPPPWNEIVPGALLLAQNVYLASRQIKKKKGESKKQLETKSPA